MNCATASLLVLHTPFVAVLSVAMFLLDLIPLVGATLGGGSASPELPAAT